jgi:hypothetical protein
LSVSGGTLSVMASDLSPQLRELSVQQSGILTRDQTQAAGLSDRVVGTLIRGRRWQRMYPGVYAAFSGALSREAALWAAVLYAGPGAALSYRTAAELWGLSSELSSLIHVTVPGNRRVVRQPGLVIHVSVSVSVHPAQSPPRTRIEETVLDLWHAARSLDDAVGWVTRAIGRRLTTPDLLRMALGARGRVRWRTELAELLSPDSAGIHSVLEYRYVRDVERPHRLPVATRQAASRRNGRSQYRDALYEAYQTVVELDGRAAHPGDSRWQDIHRDNVAATAGLTTLRYGWRDVTVTPCQVAAEIAAVLARRGYSRAKPCSPACPVGREPAAGQAPGPGQPSQHSAPQRPKAIRPRRRLARAANRRPASRDSH